MLAASNSYNVTKNVLIILTGLIWATSFWNVYNNFFIWILAAYSIYIGRKEILNPSWDDITFFLPVTLFLTYLTGLLWADDLFLGYKQVEKRTVLVVFPLVFYFLRHKVVKDDITGILYTFVFFCAGVSVICLGSAVWQIVEAGSLKVIGELERTYYYFSYKYLTSAVDLDPIYVSLYINFCIVILLFRPIKNKILMRTLVVYFVIFNVLVASRAGIIGLFSIFSLYLLGNIKHKLVALGACVFILVLLIVGVRSSTFLRERFLVSTQFDYEVPWVGHWNSISQRLAIWICAIETIEKKFPRGYGTSNGQKALEETYRSKKYIRGYEDHYNAHNEYLHTTLETGIFGLIAILMMLVWPGIQSLKAKDPLFLNFLVLIFFYFFVETALYRRDGAVFVSFFYGLLAVNGLIERRRAQTNSG